MMRVERGAHALDCAGNGGQDSAAVREAREGGIILNIEYRISILESLISLYMLLQLCEVLDL